MSDATAEPEGRFEPPAGCNDNPQSWLPVSCWGYLLPKSSSIGLSAGDQNTTPRFVDRTATDNPSNYAGDTQSQSGHRPRPPTEESRASHREERGEYMLQLTSKHTWKPYKGWEDSRHKYKVVRISCIKLLKPQSSLATAWFDFVLLVALRRRRRSGRG